MEIPTLRLTARALVLATLLVAACSPAGRGPAPGSDGPEIGRDEAVEIARQHVTFEVRSVEAERSTEQGLPVWRITFRGRPPSQGTALGEVVIVVLDRRTGELVSLGQS